MSIKEIYFRNVENDRVVTYMTSVIDNANKLYGCQYTDIDVDTDSPKEINFHLRTFSCLHEDRSFVLNVQHSYLLEQKQLSNIVTYYLYSYESSNKSDLVILFEDKGDEIFTLDDWLSLHKCSQELASKIGADTVSCGIETVVGEPLANTYFINDQVGGYITQMMEG